MRIDLHCHTSFSKDGFCSLEKIFKQAKKKGLDGIAITDHDTVAGWEKAQILAKKYDLQVILGEEITCKRNKKTIGDILGLFLTKKIQSKEPEKVMKEIKDQGGVVVVPHPFHPLVKFKDNLEKYLNLIDAIEVFNARQLTQKYDKMAKDFAKKHNFAEVGGSDCHFFKEVGNAFTEAEAKNLEDFKEAIFQRKTKVFGKKSPLVYLIFPTLARMKKFFKV